MCEYVGVTTLLLNACHKFAAVFIASRLVEFAILVVVAGLHNFPLIFRLF